MQSKNLIGAADLEWIFACNYACRACSLTFSRCMIAEMLCEIQKSLHSIFCI